MRRVTTLLAATALATAPAAPPVAAATCPLIGTAVDLVLCLVWDHLPPEARERLTSPEARCAAGHVEACDLVVCPYLVARAPGHPPVLDIRPDGDVYVSREWIWDCPPYGG